jgi:hypothetical protein
MHRSLAPILALAILLAACQPAPASPTATAIPPTETPVPATPTATPDPLASVDLRNPDTYPDWMQYFAQGEFPSVDDQKAMSAEIVHIYRNLLVDRGVQNVDIMNNGQVFFMAGQIANQEGWNLPADLETTRNWFAGPQANTYGTEIFGIFANGPYTEPITQANTSGEIVVNIFNQDTLLQRQQPYGAINASEGILVTLTEGKSAMILHYVNSGQGYYFPLSVIFTETTTTERIGSIGYGPYQILQMVAIIPPSFGANGSFNITVDSLWTEESLRQRLVNAEGIGVTAYNGPSRTSNPLIYGLEFASYIVFSR